MHIMLLFDVVTANWRCSEIAVTSECSMPDLAQCMLLAVHTQGQAWKLVAPFPGHVVKFKKSGLHDIHCLHIHHSPGF